MKRQSVGTICVISVMAAMALAATGTAAVEAKTSNPQGQARSASSNGIVDKSGVTQSKATVGVRRAIKIGSAAVRNGKVFDLELDRERGMLVWELDVASGSAVYDVTINARSGKVLRVKRDHTPDRGLRLLPAANVNAEKAARTATRAVPGAKVHGLELDRRRDRVVWEAELVTGKGVEYDVVIDAKTGKVLSKKVDD